MLVVHPSSTCDVCLEPYSWTTQANTPHAIACGHIFCLQCLQSVHPSACPLCRKLYLPERIKKLHVDRLAPGHDPEVELLLKMALVSNEDAEEEHVNNVLQDVQRWLSEGTDDHVTSESSTHQRRVAVRNMYSSLYKARNLQNQIERVVDGYTRHIKILEQDNRETKAIEQRLTEQLATSEREWEQKLMYSQNQYDEARMELERLRNDVAELRSKKPTSSNPLPPPPQPINTDRLGGFGRPMTSFSGRSGAPSTRSGSSGSTSKGTSLDFSVGPYVGPRNGGSSATRAPIMVRGSSKRVVPPRSSDNTRRETYLQDDTPIELHPDYVQNWARNQIDPLTGLSQRESDVLSQANDYTYDYPTFNPHPDAWSFPGTFPVHDPFRPVNGGSERASSRYRIYASSENERHNTFVNPTFPSADAFPAPRPYEGNTQRPGPFTSFPRISSSSIDHSRPPVADEPSVPETTNGLALQVTNDVQRRANASSLTVNSNPDAVLSPATTWGSLSTPRASANGSLADLDLRGLPVEVDSDIDSLTHSSLGDLRLAGLPRSIPASGSSSAASSLHDLRMPVAPQLSSGDNTSSSSASSGPVSTASSSSVSLSELSIVRPPRTSETASTRERESTDNNPPSERHAASRKFSLSDLNIIGLPRPSNHGQDEAGPSTSTAATGGSQHSTGSVPPSKPPSIRSNVETTSILSTSSRKSERKNRTRRVSFDPVTAPPDSDCQSPAPDPNELLTPRASHSRAIIPSIDARIGERTSIDQQSVSGGLGLSTSSGITAPPTRLVVSGQSDLNHINNSLMKLASTDNQSEARRPRRVRHTSFSDTEDALPVSNAGHRPGLAIYNSAPVSDRSDDSSPEVSHRSLPTQKSITNPIDRRSASDQTPVASQSFERDATLQPRRSSSLMASIGASSHYSQAGSSKPSAASHKSTDSQSIRSIDSKKSHRRQESAPVISSAPSISSTGSHPSALPGSSLLLNFNPTPGASEATTANGEPTAIHAPRPVNSRHTGNLFGLWGSRGDR
ncbi:hypothetical protein C8Q75DRAFT_730818 [Abortiporus biennis]|nr:hypothetical protein C8Q75DRAFT_730818 [Abortiporus biennis]